MLPLFFFVILTPEKLLITPNHVYAGENRIDLTKDTNTVYTHPSEKQCSWEPNLSNYVTFDDLSNISPWTLLETYNDGDRFNVPDGYDLYFILVKAVCSSYDGCACGLRYNSNSYAIITMSSYSSDYTAVGYAFLHTYYEYSNDKRLAISRPIIPYSGDTSFEVSEVNENYYVYSAGAGSMTFKLYGVNF